MYSLICIFGKPITVPSKNTLQLNVIVNEIEGS